MQTILVFGATGDQGHALLNRLLAGGYRVRAATREPAKFPVARYPGVEAVAADFDDQASLDAAAQGADGIVMHLPFTFDRAYAVMMGRGIAQAAKKARLGRIVFHTSCVVMDTDLGLSAHDGRRDIERELEASGVTCVFIRSAVFMDNIVRVWAKPAVVNHGVFAYPCKPDLRISWVSQDDIAAYMIAAYELAAPARQYLVGGPEALVGDEVAARLSTAIGRPVTFRSLHPDEFAGSMSKLVTGSEKFEPGSIYDRIAEFYRWYNAQSVSPLVVDLRPVLAVMAVRPTPLLVWAGEHDWSPT
nr:NmrA family NAD(P)-binding protein [Polymorphobacter sp.]